MFFFLSKTLAYFLKPLVVICVCLILSLIVRTPKWKKILFITGLSLLLLLSNEFIANEAMRAWEIEATPFSEIHKTYEYGVLLSGVTKGEAGPKDRVYVGSAADRINHTLYLYKLGYINKVLISGGSGRLIDIGEQEADEIASLLQVMGIPKDSIFIEHESRNTHESSVAVKQILGSRTTPEKCILITSASHMRRSAACFAKVGWPMDCFSTDFQSHHRTYTFDVLFIPKLEALSVWSILLKEISGYATYRIAGYI
ncbi:MAG TPA: YdcF family protein [Cyclobacteriaceae bacterium]|nr:YdcF family protein [Cyclobacteriaceae bacterium]